ncbi:HET-domain-containing protein [Aspergillus sclerotiicarbonarius CBS 121057]|uniref:HET-domain-containing protein n=1 Tax=Aspergillus sclerotiicarbonarius (strain CBS 121057 / IBT 28362) TaxID=1448318 RepID=A0A319EGG4_ASPSB|nr:HET-domain-containing protein [Aspergillus sclerotiicarbonarius CBS 121057]
MRLEFTLPSRAKAPTLSSGPDAPGNANGHVDPPLCARCRAINFNAILQLRDEVRDARLDGLSITSLGSLPTPDQDPPCPMCDLFDQVKFDLGAAAQTAWDTREYHLRAFSSIVKEVGISRETATGVKGHELIKEIRWGDAYMEDDANSVILAVFPGQGDDVLNTSEARVYDTCSHLEQGVIMPVAVPSARTHGGLVLPNQINYDRLREWIADCQSHHGAQCTDHPTRPPFSLKVIDCQTRKILPLKPDWDYYALSYVWGPPRPEDSAINGAKTDKKTLPAHVHPAIEDAITVVKNLGGRYLWTDKYCINQDDAQEKHDQVSRMDLIYSGAYATIIAAGSSIAHSGLPGVSSVPRLHQPQAVSGRTRLVSTLPSIQRALTHSTWITRGWTFQEVILSRRCLFFTDFQVYFMCSEATHCESTIISQPLIQTNPNNVLDPDRFTHLGAGHAAYYSWMPPRPWEFRTHLTHYSSRNLTYESDAINAFRGILARSTHTTYWGIPFLFERTTHPLAQDTNLRFACALAWEPTYTQNPVARESHLQRRPDFPSWSWAGWAGTVSYSYFLFRVRFTCDENDLLPQPLHNHPPLRIWVTKKNDPHHHHKDTPLIPLHHLFLTHNDKKVLPELSPHLLIDCLTLRVRIAFASRFPGDPPAFYIVVEDGYSRAPILFCWPMPREGETGHQDLLAEEWNGLILFETLHNINRCAPWDHIGIFVLLVRPIEGTNERVGSVWLTRKELEGLEMERRTIPIS